MLPVDPDGVEGGDLRDERVVTRQVGRPPRDPWAVATRCSFDYPSTIASPPVLDDGSRFPTLYWLTCPYLTEIAAREESSGATSRWSQLARSDQSLAEQLDRADLEVRRRRVEAGGGVDACAEVGLGGQRDPLGVKCLHAHIAYALAGIDDPIGCDVLARHGNACDDERCAGYEETDG